MEEKQNMSAQEVYLSTGHKPLEFMRICKQNELYFINYFEVIVDANGTIYFANPSHDKKLESLVKRNHKVDFRKAPYRYGHSEVLSQFNIASVHYDHIKCGPYLTHRQQRTLKIYLNAGLISKNSVVYYNDDYQRYNIINSFTKDDTDDYKIKSFNLVKEFRREVDKLSVALNDRYYIFGNKDAKFKTITVYRDNGEVSFKYTEDMEPDIVSEDDNYFIVDYYSEIEELNRFEPNCDYSIKLGKFVRTHTATCDYPKDKFYYKIG